MEQQIKTSLGVIIILLFTIIVSGGVYVYIKNKQVNQSFVVNTNFLTVPPVEAVNAANKAPQELLYGGTLGNAFFNYYISDKSISNYKPNADFLSVLIPSQSWSFIVSSSSFLGGAEELLYVDYLNGIWKATGIGDHGLALYFEKADENYPRHDGYEKALLKAQKCDLNFLIVRKDGKYAIYPIGLPSGVSLTQGSGPYDPSEFIEIFKKCPRLY